MTIRLLTALPPLPSGMVVTFPALIESALVTAGLASTTLSGTPLFPTLDGSVTQYPLTVRRITAAERLAPTAGMLADTRVVYDDGLQWLKVNAAGTDLEPAATPAQGVARHLPLRNSVAAAGVQFRGASDASNTLGTLGGQQYTQDRGAVETQNTLGLQQQQQMQNILNQQYQDFLNQQRYPYQQMGYMSDMLRGLPMSNSTTQMYGQQASPLSSLAGLATTAYGVSKMARGGQVKRRGGLQEMALARMMEAA